MKRRWFLAGLGLSAIGAGCRATQESAAEAGTERAESPRGEGAQTGDDTKLVMVTAANYPPYEQLKQADESADQPPEETTFATDSSADETTPSEDSPEDGQIVGFDIDLAELIAQKLDRQLSVVDLQFDALIPALVNDEADMAMAALEPTRDRKQQVDFSNIYYRSRQALISIDGYLRSRDLSYQIIGVRSNSVQARYVNSLRDDLPSLDVVTYDTLDEVFEALDRRAVEGVVVEASVADSYLQRYSDFEAQIMSSDQPTGSAIALPKNSPLQREINGAIADIKASGEMARLISKWFS
ncbi:MAG: ABC transporter substrate-binding protein [Phormidesmis sp.]